MEEKLISIIIPMYNSEKFIDETIDSLEKQTYDNFEILIIDDGSEDDSRAIVKKRMQRNNKIKYYFQNNQGAPEARNYGLKISEGDFVLFFDADDILLPNGISDLVKKVNNTNETIDIVIGTYSNLSDVTNNKKTKHLGERNNNRVMKFRDENTNTEALREAIFLSPIPGTKLIRRDFLIKNNIKFEKLRLAQDLNFYLQIIAHKPNLVKISNDVLLYRKHNNSISHTYDDKMIDIIKCFELIEASEFDIYTLNSSFFETLKFNHVAMKILSIPKIKNDELKENIYSKLIKYLNEIDKNNLIQSLTIKRHRIITTFASQHKKIYLSNIFAHFFNALKK